MLVSSSIEVEGDKRRLYRCCGAAAAAAFLPRGFLSGGGAAPVMRMVNSDMVAVLVEVGRGQRP